jgi:hypothetical protein
MSETLYYDVVMSVVKRTLRGLHEELDGPAVSAHRRAIAEATLVSHWMDDQKFTQTQTQNNLFSLGMLTYTYERQDIIQIALKRLPGGGGVP